MSFTSDHTFVVTAFGDSPHLSACLDSLRRQTIANKVVLSTSTPSLFLESKAEEFGIPLLINPVRRGPACDWTFALQSSSSRYVTLAHQDDTYDPEFAECSVDAAERHPDFLIVFSDYRELRGDSVCTRNLILDVKRLLLWMAFGRKAEAGSQVRKWASVAFGSPICCPAVLYNRERLSGFAFSDRYLANVDWDAWIRLATVPGSFVRVNRMLVSHRVHSDSGTTRAIAGRTRWNEDYSCFKQLWPAPLARALVQLYSLSYRSNG